VKRAAPAEDSRGLEQSAPRTFAESAYRRIRNDILWGRLPPGAPLKSDELRNRYDIGVSPLREALTRLAAERLVYSVGQKGFRVAELTIDDVLDTQRTRFIIEREALTQSIKYGDLAWEMAVVSAFHGLSRNPTPTQEEGTIERWAYHHRQFHMTLLSACGSKWQMEFAGLLFDQAERHRIMRVRINTNEQLVRDVQAEHSAIFEAILTRNTQRAVEALEMHYVSTAKQVVAALSNALRSSTS
jgi:DNA-binding GntR family transcriptional regulator